MNVKEYIASGILELYVAGTLSAAENLEVAQNAKTHPEILKEIEAIEASILTLSKEVYPSKYPHNFDTLKKRIHLDSKKVISLPKQKKSWTSYMGWAATILLTAGLFWMYNQNNSLRSEIESARKENIDLEQKIANSRASEEKTRALLTTLRDKNITVVPLGGQDVSPNSYAKVYWNKSEEKVFIDAQGLPKPPDGMVYQVWSLQLDPLSPTSIGLLEDFATDGDEVFALPNTNDSEAFGITLEPAGGSALPNIEQLYTLGVVAS